MGKLKIPADVLERMREVLVPLDTEERRQAYREGNFPRAELVKDLDQRYRWDLYWSARDANLLPPIHEMAPELNDNHVTSALKSIVPSL